MLCTIDVNILSCLCHSTVVVWISSLVVDTMRGEQAHMRRTRAAQRLVASCSTTCGAWSHRHSAGAGVHCARGSHLMAYATPFSLLPCPRPQPRRHAPDTVLVACLPGSGFAMPQACMACKGSDIKETYRTSVNQFFKLPTRLLKSCLAVLLHTSCLRTGHQWFM